MTESRLQKVLVVLLVIALLALLIVGSIFFMMTNAVIEWKIYPKNAEVLNLRGKEISISHYERVREAFPYTEIYWDVPFQGSSYPEDTEELTVAALTDEDVMILGYFKQLHRLHAQNCKDYPQLIAYREANPDCQLFYSVTIDGQEYSQDAQYIEITNLTDEEVVLLDLLPQLNNVNAQSCDDYAQLAELQQRHPECLVDYSVTIAGQDFAVDSKELVIEGADAEQVHYLLQYLPLVEKVHLVDPVSNGQSLLQLRQQREDIAFTWELDFQGVLLKDTDTEVDISGTLPENLDQVSALMDYLPDAEKLIMTDCGFDNEAMAAFRETKRPDYKVIWTVMCGTIPVRTDEIFFHPIQERVYYFFDEDAYNLRYCEDMICVDVGHMALHDISWVEYMPNLKYLILCLTTVLDITPLSTCKNLIFLELDMTGIQDYTPLLGCTALEDLNLGLTYGDPAPIAQMTWLKNLWWKGKGYQTMVMLQEALPDTNMNFNPKTTSGGGWRKLQNYYDMRDILGMHYMN